MTDSTIRSTPASAPASMPDSTPASTPDSTPASATYPIQIEATPFAYRFAPGRTALVVIDMQRDFIEPGGFGESLGNDVGRLQPAIAPIARLLAAWRARGWPIVHTRESHRADLSDCPPAKRLRGEPLQRIGEPGPMGRLLIRGEPGTSIIDELQPREGEIVVDKPGKGMFWATGLQETLQAHAVSHLVFTGVTTEVCVQTSMREANDRGYDCLLVEDATESYFPAFKTATLAMIAAQGAIVGWHAPSETLLKSLVMDLGRPSGSGSASPGVADPPRG